ncbi:MAG: hypothetical protein KVP17_005031, partial [Porospora cf. gigantea B]
MEVLPATGSDSESVSSTTTSLPEATPLTIRTEEVDNSAGPIKVLATDQPKAKARLCHLESSSLESMGHMKDDSSWAPEHENVFETSADGQVKTALEVSEDRLKEASVHRASEMETTIAAAEQAISDISSTSSLSDSEESLESNVETTTGATTIEETPAELSDDVSSSSSVSDNNEPLDDTRAVEIAKATAVIEKVVEQITEVTTVAENVVEQTSSDYISSTSTLSDSEESLENNVETTTAAVDVQ